MFKCDVRINDYNITNPFILMFSGFSGPCPFVKSFIEMNRCSKQKPWCIFIKECLRSVLFYIFGDYNDKFVYRISIKF